MISVLVRLGNGLLLWDMVRERDEFICGVLLVSASEVLWIPGKYNTWIGGTMLVVLCKSCPYNLFTEAWSCLWSWGRVAVLGAGG